MSKASAEAFVQKIMEDEALRERTEQTSPEDVLPIAKEMGYDFTVEELTEVMNSSQELEPAELEDVVGGAGPHTRPMAKHLTQSAINSLYNRYCHGDPTGTKHDYVREGHYEVPFLKYWSKGYDVLRCKRCGHVWNRRVTKSESMQWITEF